MTQAFLVQDLGQSLPLAVQGLRAVVAVSLVRRNDAGHRQVLHFVPLHLHMDPLLLGVPIEHERRDRRHRLVMAPINIRQRWYAARRVALRTPIQELTMQALELLVVPVDHLQMLISRRYRPLAQVARHTVNLRKLAVCLHGTLLSRDVIVYPEAMGLVLVVELHVQEVLILLQLRLGAIPLVHQLAQVALLQPVIIVAHSWSISFVL